MPKAQSTAPRGDPRGPEVVNELVSGMMEVWRGGLARGKLKQAGGSAGARFEPAFIKAAWTGIP